MYQITYKKKNGEIFNRYRNSLPGAVGEETSMGWIILDIKYSFDNGYYSYNEYKQLWNKRKKVNKVFRNINSFLKKYANTIIIAILIPLYLFK